MPAGKTQTQKYVSNMLFSLFPCIKLWGACWLNYLLNSPGLHSVSSRRKELPVWPPWHDYWKGPKARPKWYYWGFQALVFTNPIEKSSSPSTPHSRFLILRKFWYPKSGEFLQNISIFSWTYTRKTEISKISKTSQFFKLKKICQIKALPPFKPKPSFLSRFLVSLYGGIIISLRLDNKSCAFSKVTTRLYTTIQ